MPAAALMRSDSKQRRDDGSEREPGDHQ